MKKTTQNYKILKINLNCKIYNFAFPTWYNNAYKEKLIKYHYWKILVWFFNFLIDTPNLLIIFSGRKRKVWKKRDWETLTKKAGHGGPLMLFEAKKEDEIWIWFWKGYNVWFSCEFEKLNQNQRIYKRGGKVISENTRKVLSYVMGDWE